MSSRQRAQSEVIGVTLLIGVVVILVGIATVFILSGTGGSEEPLADLQFEATAGNVSVTNVGGDDVPVGELRLVVRGEGGTGRFTVDAANLSGADDELGLGDSITRRHGVTSRTFRVLLVHEPTNAILGRDALDVPDPGEPSASFTYVPGTPQPGETVTFDAGGSRAPDGTITSYEWDFDDGTVTSTGSSTIDHSFASEGDYNVTLTVTTDAGKTAATNRTVSVTTPSAASLSWDTAGDWDGATAENGVVHERYGDRTAGAVELGYPSTDRGSGTLLVYYPFDDDTGGTAIDASASSHDGSVTGATASSGGIFETDAYTFDGDEDFVEDADAESYLQGQDGITLSAWVRSDVTGTNRGAIFGKDPDGTDTSAGFRYDSSGFEAGCTDCLKTGFTIGGDETTYESASNQQTSGWQHVVVTWSSGNQIRMFLNGSEDTPTHVQSNSGTLSEITRLLIGQGAKDSGSNDGWDGRIDEVRIYDRALSASEASSLYSASQSGSLTTGQKTFATARDPANLQLTNVAATLPAGTGIDVTVESDPDGDGTFEETSDAITLDGSGGPYDVTGLSSPSGTFRLVVQPTTSSPTDSPSLDRADLAANP